MCFNRDIRPLLHKTGFVCVKNVEVPCLTRSGRQKVNDDGSPVTRKGKSVEFLIDKDRLLSVWKKAQENCPAMIRYKHVTRHLELNRLGYGVKDSVKRIKGGDFQITTSIRSRITARTNEEIEAKVKQLLNRQDRVLGIMQIGNLEKVGEFGGFLILYLRRRLEDWTGGGMPNMDQIFGDDFILSLRDSHVSRKIVLLSKRNKKINNLCKALLDYSKLAKSDYIGSKSSIAMESAIYQL